MPRRPALPRAGSAARIRTLLALGLVLLAGAPLAAQQVDVAALDAFCAWAK